MESFKKNMILFDRSVDEDHHQFVVHYDTYNTDATLGLDSIFPLGKLKSRKPTFLGVISFLKSNCFQKVYYNLPFFSSKEVYS